jgi:hypothetical protein
MVNDMARRLERELARDNPAFAKALAARDAALVANTSDGRLIEAVMTGIAPILRRHIDDAVTKAVKPLNARISALEKRVR